MIEPYADPSQRNLATIDPAAPRLLRLALTWSGAMGDPGEWQWPAQRCAWRSRMQWRSACGWC